MPGHIDLRRMLQGRLGGLFMVAWTPCPPSHLGAPEAYLDTGEVGWQGRRADNRVCATRSRRSIS